MSEANQEQWESMSFDERKEELGRMWASLNETARKSREEASKRHEDWKETRNNEEDLYKSALSKLTIEELEVLTGRILNTERTKIINKNYSWFNDKTIIG